MAQTSIKDFGFGGGGAGGTVGDYIVSTADTAPEGYIEAGKVYNQSAYPDLYNCVGIVHNTIGPIIDAGTGCYSSNGACIASPQVWSPYHCDYDSYLWGNADKTNVHFSCTNNVIKAYTACIVAGSSCKYKSTGVLKWNLDCVKTCINCCILSAPLCGSTSGSRTYYATLSNESCECRTGGSEYDRGNSTWVTDNRCRAIIMHGVKTNVCGMCNLPEVHYTFTNDGGETITHCCNITSPTCWVGYGMAQNGNCQFAGQQPFLFHDPKTDKFVAFPAVGWGSKRLGPYVYTTDNFTSWSVDAVCYLTKDGAGNCSASSFTSCCGCCAVGMGHNSCNHGTFSVRTFYNKSEDCTYIHHVGGSSQVYERTFTYEDSTKTLIQLPSSMGGQVITEDYIYRIDGIGTNCTSICMKPNGSTPNYVPYYTPGYLENSYGSAFKSCVARGLFEEVVCKNGRNYAGTFVKQGDLYSTRIFSLGGSAVEPTFVGSDHTAYCINPHTSNYTLCSTCERYFSITYSCLVNYDPATQFFVPAPCSGAGPVQLNNCNSTFKYYIKATG